jgi:hypothetical protein
LREDRRYFSTDRATSDEVKVVDLGGQFVSIATIAPADQNLLALAYNGASKASAHLTEANHGFNPGTLPRLAETVLDLVIKNLYAHVPIRAVPTIAFAPLKVDGC